MDREWRVVMRTAQDLESLRGQFNEAVVGTMRTMGKSASQPRSADLRVGKPEPYALGKDLDD